MADRGPIYSLPLRALDHRLLWWLLCHQAHSADGRPTGLVRGPWRQKAIDELGTHRPKLWAAEKRLRESGVLIGKTGERDVRLDGRAFQ